MSAAPPHAAGVEPVLRLAAATNRSIAGSGFVVEPAVPDADALRSVLRRLGAAEMDDADLVFTVAAAATIARVPRRVPGRPPVVLVDCGDPAPITGERVRPGVVGTRRPDVVVVPMTVANPDADPVFDAAGRIEWARTAMPVSARLVGELRDDGLLDGVRIGLSLVLEPKTAVLALLLADAGADVAVFAFGDETDDAVAAVLRGRGIAVDARAEADADTERTLALRFLDRGPRLLVDDGSHVLRLAHAARPDVVAGLLGASEETTSGLTPLRAMAADGALRVPVIAANDARSKTAYDNRYGTGETCVLTIAGLGVDPAAAPVVVIGFGPVGEGVAEATAALGALVTVVERDPARALAARYAGYRVAPLLEAVRDAGLVVSATGVPDTVSLAVLEACADGCAIAVAGGVPQEVALDAASAAGAIREPVRAHVEDLVLAGGRRVRLLAGGGCVNIVAGEGNPIEIMDLSFAVQASALRMLLTRPLPPGVHPLDPALDDRIAALALGSDPQAAQTVAPADWRRTRFSPGGTG